MQSFNLVRANDSASAISAGAQSDTAQQGARVRFLAGGTTLVDLMKLGVEHPERVISITRLPLADIRKEANGDLVIGATARNSDVAHHPLVAGGYAALSQALLAGASAQLRNAATTAGNLLQRTRCMYFRDLASPCNKRKPGAGCAAIGGANRTLAILGGSQSCIATHPSDMAVAMMAYDAVVHVLGTSVQGATSGARRIPLKDFYVLPQDRPDIENVLKPGDLVTYVALPPRPAGERAFYLKLRDRASYEFALVSAAVAVTLAQGKITSARLALGGVGTRPWRVPEAEQLLVGEAPSVAAFRSAAEICLRDARPQSQNGFKVELAKRCVVYAFKHVTN
jgi:xanthine dehydrogenase YagS FAD-binding subunit